MDTNPPLTNPYIYKWTFSPRLLEAYNESKTYSCKEINYLTFTISSATKNQEYHPPSDAHPIYAIQNQFTIQVNSQLIKNNPPNPSTFIDYCKNLQQWKKQLLQHIFTEYPDSLATRIQEGAPLIIATDGTKSRKQSGGGWIITTIAGKIAAHGANPDLGSMGNIHSHRSEAYAILSVLLFLSEYAKYFRLPLVTTKK